VCVSPAVEFCGAAIAGDTALNALDATSHASSSTKVGEVGLDLMFGAGDGVFALADHLMELRGAPHALVTAQKVLHSSADVVGVTVAEKKRH
jgi:hypothetical protein